MAQEERRHPAKGQIWDGKKYVLVSLLLTDEEHYLATRGLFPPGSLSIADESHIERGEN